MMSFHLLLFPFLYPKPSIGEEQAMAMKSVQTSGKSQSPWHLTWASGLWIRLLYGPLLGGQKHCKRGIIIGLEMLLIYEQVQLFVFTDFFHRNVSPISLTTSWFFPDRSHCKASSLLIVLHDTRLASNQRILQPQEFLCYRKQTYLSRFWSLFDHLFHAQLCPLRPWPHEPPIDADRFMFHVHEDFEAKCGLRGDLYGQLFKFLHHLQLNCLSVYWFIPFKVTVYW